MTKSQHLQQKKRRQKMITKRAINNICLNMLIIIIIAFICTCYSIVNKKPDFIIEITKSTQSTVVEEDIDPSEWFVTDIMP